GAVREAPAHRGGASGGGGGPPARLPARVCHRRPAGHEAGLPPHLRPARGLPDDLAPERRSRFAGRGAHGGHAVLQRLELPHRHRRRPREAHAGVHRARLAGGAARPERSAAEVGRAMGRVSARSLASAAVLLVWLVLLAPAARAQSGSALTRLAQRIATVTPTTPAFAAVTPLAGVTLAEAERAQLDAKLARVLGSAVTGARGRGATALTEGAARERSRELGLALVLVRPTLAGGLLSVDVDVIEWELSFWARTRKPGGTVVTHASFSEPA